MPTATRIQMSSVIPAVLNISGVTENDEDALLTVLTTMLFSNDSDVKVAVNITSIDSISENNNKDGNSVSLVASMSSVFYRVMYNIYLTYHNDLFSEEGIHDTIVTQIDRFMTSGEFVAQLRSALNYSNVNDTAIGIVGYQWGEIRVISPSTTQQPTSFPSQKAIIPTSSDDDSLIGPLNVVGMVGVAAFLFIIIFVLLALVCYYRKKRISKVQTSAEKYNDIEANAGNQDGRQQQQQQQQKQQQQQQQQEAVEAPPPTCSVLREEHTLTVAATALRYDSAGRGAPHHENV